MKKAIVVISLTLLALVLCGMGLLAVFFHQVVMKLMRPSGPFAAAAVPKAPDYASPAAWTALPTRVDAADAAVPALPAVDQRDPRSAAADVFYIHPTTYIGNGWNGPTDKPRLNADTDRVATRIQASVFNSCCAVYGPRYRQANGTAFSHPSADGQRAIDVATADVVSAFRYYLEHDNRGRPFFIAGHSQGTMLAYRLLREEITGKPARQQLVAAYLLGGSLFTSALAKELPDIPVCATPEQTGCVISFNARGPRYVPGELEIHSLQTLQPASELVPSSRVCTNPLTFRADGIDAAANQNHGALFLDADLPEVLPGFASAGCHDGTLVVTPIGKPPRDLPSRLLDRELGPQNYHPIEYQLFYVNLRENAELRVAAYLKQHSPGPTAK